jgi:hypothetical protein
MNPLVLIWLASETLEPQPHEKAELRVRYAAAAR